MGWKGRRALRTDGHGEVRNAQSHVVYAVLVDTKYISVCAGRVVERRNQIFEGAACLYVLPCIVSLLASSLKPWL